MSKAKVDQMSDLKHNQKLLEKCLWLAAIFSNEEIDSLFAAFDESGRFIGIGFIAHNVFTQFGEPAKADAIAKLEDLFRYKMIEIEERNTPKRNPFETSETFAEDAFETFEPRKTYSWTHTGRKFSDYINEAFKDEFQKEVDELIRKAYTKPW